MTQIASTVEMKAESTLVTEARAGNHGAFEELANRHVRKIYRLVLKITRNPEDAEDVLQETFLKAFQHLPAFREDARFYTWITRIGVKEGLMKLRKRRSGKEVPIEDSLDNNNELIPREFADWRPNPEQQFARTELGHVLRGAVQSLPATLRIVFYLRDVEGFSTGETAELLDLSKAAVKARSFRARLRMRKDLSKTFTDGDCVNLRESVSPNFQLPRWRRRRGVEAAPLSQPEKASEDIQRL